MAPPLQQEENDAVRLAAEFTLLHDTVMVGPPITPKGKGLSFMSS
jgi:hypothetical protein